MSRAQTKAGRLPVREMDAATLRELAAELDREIKHWESEGEVTLLLRRRLAGIANKYRRRAYLARGAWAARRGAQ